VFYESKPIWNRYSKADSNLSIQVEKPKSLYELIEIDAKAGMVEIESEAKCDVVKSKVRQAGVHI
jgi:hypothetical protein